MRYILITLLYLGSLGALSAQERNIYIGMSYNPALPLGETGEYVENVFSPRGVTLEARKFLSNRLSVGLQVGWNIFLRKVRRQTFEVGDVTLNGTQYRSLNIVPFLATGHYYFRETGPVRPHAGLGLGGYYVDRRNDIGTFSLTDKSVQFGLAPAVGVAGPLNDLLYYHVSLRYHYALPGSETSSQSFLGIEFGVAYEW